MSDYNEFIVEISKNIGRISEILVNLQTAVNTIPDKRDNVDVIDKINTIETSLMEVVTLVTAIGNYHNTCSAIINPGLKDVVERLEIAVDKIPDSNNLKDILDRLEEGEIQKAGNLAKILMDQYDTALIKWGTSPITIVDIKDIVDYAKRKNRLYEFWKGSKAKAMIVIGILTAFLMYAEKIFAGIKSFLKLFGGG